MDCKHPSLQVNEHGICCDCGRRPSWALLVRCSVCDVTGRYLPTDIPARARWANIGPGGFLCPDHNGDTRRQEG